MRKKILVHLGYSINSISGSILCNQLRYIKEKYEKTHDIILILSGVKTLRNSTTVSELSGISLFVTDLNVKTTHALE